MHQQLLGHVLGALDDDEQQWLEARLEHDDERRRELARWRRRLAALDALRPDFEPPPGLTERTYRLVAAFGPPPVPAAAPVVGMSPDLSLAGRGPQYGWSDVMAIGVVLMTAIVLVLPAIDGSRFHARLASCRDGLRRFGLALTEYGQSHGEALPQLAGGGRLTDAGVFAAELLRAESPEAGRPVCPDAWFAAQGGDRVFMHSPSEAGQLDAPETAVPGRFAFGQRWPPAWVSNTLDDLSGDWPGTWRDGTMGGFDDPLPTAEALLADAPSDVLPGQGVEYHGGRGRNFFFADGHVEFVPSGARRDAPQAILPAGGNSAPIIFVGGH